MKCQSSTVMKSFWQFHWFTFVFCKGRKEMELVQHRWPLVHWHYLNTYYFLHEYKMMTVIIPPLLKISILSSCHIIDTCIMYHSKNCSFWRIASCSLSPLRNDWSDCYSRRTKEVTFKVGLWSTSYWVVRFCAEIKCAPATQRCLQSYSWLVHDKARWCVCLPDVTYRPAHSTSLVVRHPYYKEISVYCV